ncbi:MAG: hypothetical protein ACK56F_09780, partial [bacterium]
MRPPRLRSRRQRTTRRAVLRPPPPRLPARGRGGAAEEVPACCGTTGPGVEKREASLPTLKAAAGNPEGSFTPAAAEAVMTEAVGPLVTADVGKTRPPDCTSRHLAGSTDRLWARKKSIPRMAVET